MVDAEEEEEEEREVEEEEDVFEINLQDLRKERILHHSHIPGSHHPAKSLGAGSGGIGGTIVLLSLP